MVIVLRVIEGPEQGREFRFQEADNLLVGRQDRTSRAQLNITADPAVSRHHFTLEVRPPNLMLRDHHSRNGTFLRRRGAPPDAPWERIDETLVYDGDQIKIGRTVLAVTVSPTEPLAELPALAAGPSEPPLPELRCLWCDVKAVEPWPDPAAGNVQLDDFMCPDCQRESRARRARETERLAQARYTCLNCQRDVTAQAGSDGRAAELAEVALYFCPDCAGKADELLRPPVGGYRLLKRMGQSGLGVVYQAWHPDTGRLATLKQILPIAQSSRADTVLFMRDLYLIDMMHCDCLVRLYEAGLHQRQPFFISEFLPGGSLDQFVSAEGKARLAPRQAVELISGALDSLVQMHVRGDVHRGLKPENIVIRDLASPPKLADFGLASSYEKHGGTITRTGEFADAIMYMPPEQIRSFARARPVVDVYAMGVILYYLLTGHYPLDFPNLAEVRAGARLTKDPARMILEDPPRPVGERESSLPPALCAVVDQAVHKEPGERFASALEFQAALRRALADL